MLKLKHTINASILAATILAANSGYAEDWYPAQAPASYHVGGVTGGTNMVGCTTCHSGSPYTENNVTKSFGVAFAQISDDDNAGTLVKAYNTLAALDSDGDGWSNQQESFFGSDINLKTLTPSLAVADKNITTVAAKAVSGGPVDVLSLQAGMPATALGGTVSFSSPYNNLAGALTQTNFLFQAGGVQTGVTVAFYDKAGVVIADTPTNTADRAYSPTALPGSILPDGRITVSVKDESVFDLYSTAVFQQEAIALSTKSTISPYATVDPYISPWAKISPSATIEPYAQIDAYAVVEANATIGAYAHIGSYAYVASNIVIYTGINATTKVTVDAYANVSSNITAPTVVAAQDGKGYISAKFAVTTTPPTTRILGSSAGGDSDDDNDGDGTSTGGLHCMTTNLTTPALMFFSLFIAGLFIRRKLG